MDNRGKWNSRKEFARETEAVKSFSERFYLGYTATTKEIEKKKTMTLTDSARVESEMVSYFEI